MRVWRSIVGCCRAMNIEPITQARVFRGKAGLSRAAAVALSLVGLSGCVSEFDVPRGMPLPIGEKVMLHTYARGVQIYACETNALAPGNLVWRLKAPEATLYDSCGKIIGSHYAGPTWELDCDGSKISGEEVQRMPSPDSTAIPWLLVKAKSPEGTGQLQRVTYIQRVNTTGGLGPIEAPTQVGQEVRSRYTAEYYFYREKK